MATPTNLRHLLRLPAPCRLALLQPQRPQPRTLTYLAPTQLHPRFLTLPRIIQPSFWASMLPSGLRNWSSGSKTREWNPATPYILLGLLVGSQAIQILWLKQERGHTLRRAEAKIGVLREVIERVQNGEDVNVEEILGTGDEKSEQEWKEVLKEIENEEILFQSKKERRALRKAAAEQEEKQGREEERKEQEVKAQDATGTVKVESVGGVRFY